MDRAGRWARHLAGVRLTPGNARVPVATATRLLQRCTFPEPGSHLDCAVSGGPDSLALLVLAVAAGCEVVAWHVDHGLRPGSGGETARVAEAAAALGAGFEARQVRVEPGPNQEARARAARFAALPAGVATGHTADDQAETVLLNLLRGAGGPGLAGMRAGRRHPILSLRRAETVAVTDEAGLTPLIDPTNADPAYRRNRVRHELLPLCGDIAGRDVVPVVARQAALIAAENDLLDELSGAVDAQDAKSLAAAHPVLARRALRRWLATSAAGYPPSAASIERVMEVARGRCLACEVEGGRRVRRTAGRLELERAPAARH
jgi:tRNA(Ile)-lysidine synthase